MVGSAGWPFGRFGEPSLRPSPFPSPILDVQRSMFDVKGSVSMFDVDVERVCGLPAAPECSNFQNHFHSPNVWILLI